MIKYDDFWYPYGLHCMFLPLGDSDHFFPHSVAVFFLAHSFSLLVRWYVQEQYELHIDMIYIVYT